jgi:hypothetical protein
MSVSFSLLCKPCQLAQIFDGCAVIMSAEGVSSFGIKHARISFWTDGDFLHSDRKMIEAERDHFAHINSFFSLPLDKQAIVRLFKPFAARIVRQRSKSSSRQHDDLLCSVFRRAHMWHDGKIQLEREVRGVLRICQPVLHTPAE